MKKLKTLGHLLAVVTGACIIAGCVSDDVAVNIDSPIVESVTEGEPSPDDRDQQSEISPEPNSDVVRVSPDYVTPTLTPSKDGIRPTDASTAFGHPTFNNATGYINNPHPQAFHLYEYAPVDLPPAVTRERLSELAVQFKAEFQWFEVDVLRQMNEVYSDIAAGMRTSDDEFIQAVDYDFAEDIERCVTEWSPGRQIVTYASCFSTYFAYRVAAGGVLVTELWRNVPYSHPVILSDVPARFIVGGSREGFNGHGPTFGFEFGLHRDLGEYAQVSTRVRSGFDGIGSAYLIDDGPIEDQVERNKTALLLEAAINNLIAIRTGTFVF